MQINRTISLCLAAMAVAAVLGLVAIFSPVPQAGALTAGALVRGSSPAVYYYSSDGKRYAFPTEAIYKTWYSDFSQVTSIADADLAKIPLGGNVTYRPGVRMVKIRSNPTVYAVDARETLRPIASESVAKALYGASWNTMIDDVDDSLFANYVLGDAIATTSDYSPSSARALATSIDAVKNRTVADHHGIDKTAIPLGDGKYASTPKAGYIYACQSSFNGRGAQADGPWISGSTWDATHKISVQGDVHWPNATVSISEDGSHRVITSNNLPNNHNTGTFPIQNGDPAYQYDRNPNAIKTQTVSVTVPAAPTVASAPTCVRGEVGVALNGVPIFDGFDAEGRDAVAHEIQDSCDGHPQEFGQYHYHSGSPCFKLGNGELFGYAFDGFGIYYETDAQGNELTNADLDECHGRTSEVLWDGKKVQMYHYVVTDEFPYTVGCFKGKPSQNQAAPSSGGNQSLPPPPRW